MTDAAPTIGSVLALIARTAADAVAASEGAALADEPDGVHQHRVRVRRLRSVLAGFRPLLDAPAVERLRVLYGQWGAQLGTVRDIEVLADVAEEAMAELGIDDPDARRRLVDDQRAEYAHAHARLVELAGEPRAQDRARLLAAFAASAPILDAGHPARPVLADVLRGEARRVRRAAARADGTVESYHVVRKAGRRMRYVAEAVRDAAPDLFGDEVDDLAESGDQIHGALGNHRDALVFARRLELTRALAARAGEPVHAYDAMLAHAHASAGDHLSALEAALDEARAAAKRLP